ncbi:DUF3006 domain-containing protein [Clostridiisalibacter paucivorans]|uniref:DUF3006 domain-containing protein n=1 Tax=Clostridiisalibacter paucivorans TaxID=408753 RepID=UPI00047C75E8|nr:DUF3006 domain-containing protein [Clostridiisalibacter paucivorans]
MKGVIDRFEGLYAVIELENGEMKNILIEKLPLSVTEGDILIIEKDKISIDKQESKRRKKRIERLMNELME